MPSTHTKTASFLDELAWRGLLYQATADEPLREHLSAPGRVGYCGFDPTADSLTVGHLIPIKLLRHWQQHGHRPVVLMGGGTGLIGDPSGKESERQLLTAEQVRANVEAQRPILERLLDFDGSSPNAATIVNNLDWLEPIGYLQMLREIGKHFSIGSMLQRDAVRERLQREHGLSYTEFSYIILQAYDFLHLHREMNCTVQMAGSDQYGNIVAGVDLIRRMHAIEQPDAHEEHASHLAFGLTAPLLLGADGKKIGKSESGAVYLAAHRTSPYAFYQYWINASDADAGPFLRWFTMLDQEQIEQIMQRHEPQPHERHAQRELARHMTELIHGPDELQSVEAASAALFRGGPDSLRSLNERMLAEVFADVPHSTHPKQRLGGGGAALVEVLPETTLCSSRREARQHLAGGAISVNGERVDADYALKMSDLLHGRMILLRRGRKTWHATRWE